MALFELPTASVVPANGFCGAGAVASYTPLVNPPGGSTFPARLVVTEYQGGAIAFADVPAWVCELILPLGFGVMGLRYLALGIGRLRGATPP